MYLTTKNTVSNFTICYSPLCMTRESLDLIFYPSVGEEQVVTFETVFFAVRYMWALVNLKFG